MACHAMYAERTKKGVPVHSPCCFSVHSALMVPLAHFKTITGYHPLQSKIHNET